MTTATIPAMTSEGLLQRLEEIGAGWQGLGCAVECGSWLGASACALARGLVRAGYDRPLHLYDMWWANASEVEKARAGGVDVRLGQNLEPICRRNVEAVYADLVTHRGRIELAAPPAEPIEILVLDAAKRDPAFSLVIAHFVRHCVPGATLCMLDFHFWKHAVPERRQDYYCQQSWANKYCSEMGDLEDLGGFGGTSAHFFRVLRPIYPEET